MKNLKNNIADITYFDGNIVFQCTYNHKIYRYRVFKVREDLFNKKTKTLKECDGLYNAEYETNRIQNLYEKVNKAFVNIIPTLQPNETLTKKKIDDYITQYIENENIIIEKKDPSFVETFENWITEYKEKKTKEDKLRGLDRRLHPACKDYISCLNLLKDYQHDNDTTLRITDINNNFLLDLSDYAYEIRNLKDGDYKYLTQGELCNKTLQKRFDCLFTFLKDRYRIETLYLKKPKLEFIQSEIVCLDLDELQKLINVPIKEAHYQKIRDYFLFLCHTGLRFSDFIRLDRTFYNEKENKIKLQSQKTFADCEIYLFDIAKQIGEKYNFEFKDYTNQSLNRELKDMLLKYNLFSENHTKTFYQRGRKTDTKPKREFISTHTGRKTFISLLFQNNFDIFAVMGMTGHKRIETLKFYADKYGSDRIKQMQTLNNKINNVYNGKEKQ